MERVEPATSPVAPSDPEPVRVQSGARVRVGGDVRVEEGERVKDVVAVFGRVDVNGTVEGNAVAVFGDVVVGPRGSVRGDVAAIGGRVIGAEGASLYGNLTQVGWSLPDLRFTFGDRNMTTVEVVPDWPRIARVQWWITFVGMGLLALLCGTAVVLSPRHVETAVHGSRPIIVAWVVGLLVQVLALPVLVGVTLALVASVVGIPLLVAVPIAILLLATASVVGISGFAVRVGSRVLPPSWRGTPSLVALFAGFLILAGPVVVGSYYWHATGGTSLGALAVILLGTFVEYTWWTVGLGAGVMAWLRSRRRKTPPEGAEGEAARIDTLPLPSGV